MWLTPSPGSDEAHASAAAAFDSGRAFEHIRRLVAIGPRDPGSVGSQQARRYIMEQLRASGLTPVEQAFDADTPLGPKRMANVTVTIQGASPARIVVGGHYDTKLFRQFRFVGANDGGSSAALLLELARVLKGRKNPLTLEMVFFDGEEALVDWVGSDHTYGSRHYVGEARRTGAIKDIRAMLLVDMVGDRDLRVRRESQSTRWLTDTIWAAARRIGHGAIFVDEEILVEDDHVPFLRAGIPAANIIDLDYAAWHTPEDTLDKVSARSLQVVGEVVLGALPAIEARLARK
jgi:Zn-dependent M28 family amino/carboxypeptidase